MSAIFLTKLDTHSRFVDLLVILDDESMERCKQSDPFSADLIDLASTVGQGVRVRGIGFVYANDDDRSVIVGLSRDGKHAEAMAFAVRGHQNKPGDEFMRPFKIEGKATC